MSKIILICARNSDKCPFFDEKIKRVSQRIAPDNITVNSPHIITKNRISIAILNPVESIPIKNASVCMGNLIGQDDDWWKPLAKIPDGTFALFRSDKDSVEVISDIVASRTVWYFKNDDVFIASTSQRAIVCFLQDFKPNTAVFPWVLSSGTLGPGLSWDGRIKCLSGDTRLLLDRSSWRITIKKQSSNFDPIELSDEEHERNLKKALEETFELLNLNYSKWVLPLSGGFDSRTILLMLENRQNLKCITWGLKSSVNDKNNDVYIAKLLAKHFSLDHQYFETDISNEPIEKIFDRFIMAGEGRIDHIAGYADGFKIWKTMFENKIFGSIRGDQACGNPINSFIFFNPRRHCAARLLSDYSNLKNLDKFGFRKQIWPKNLQRKKMNL